jgi:hypothetical protein
LPDTESGTLSNNIMELINLRFTLDQECPVDEYMDEGYFNDYFTRDDGTYQVIIKNVDDVLIESLTPDDLVEFFGIDSEFLIATEVI